MKNKFFSWKFSWRRIGFGVMIGVMVLMLLIIIFFLLLIHGFFDPSNYYSY